MAPEQRGRRLDADYNGDLFDAGHDEFGARDRSYSWVGQADDPFFLDLRVFDLLYGANLSEAGDDTLAGFNVNTFALQVPKARPPRAETTGSIGVWTTASRPSMRVQTATERRRSRGKNVQVSRLGMPLVNEVVVPVGLKDYFNASKPKDDGAVLPLVQDPELPHLAERGVRDVTSRTPTRAPRGSSGPT